MTEALSPYPVETVLLTDLKNHPRNYVVHPADQLAHIAASLELHGQYANIVIARDGTLLRGHGVTAAARYLKWETLQAIRLPIDPLCPQALKLLTGDNEMSHLREVDDRALADLLKEIKAVDVDGLLGTGYDSMMLANLVYVTRPKSELTEHREADQWVGMPDYEAADPDPLQAVISFRSEEDRAEFAQVLGIRWRKAVGKTRTAWWPVKEMDDTASVRFKGRA